MDKYFWFVKYYSCGHAVWSSILQDLLIYSCGKKLKKICLKTITEILHFSNDLMNENDVFLYSIQQIWFSSLPFLHSKSQLYFHRSNV